MRRLVVLAALALAGSAAAHGRFPASTQVALRDGDERLILLGTTFGLVVSRDGGATWDWVCEEAIGYLNSLDPVFAVTHGGAWLATSHTGLRLSRDEGCTWQAASGVGETWPMDIAVGGDGAIWVVTAAGGAPNHVLVSRDDGGEFTPAHTMTDSFFRSVRVAPSDARRVYASGARIVSEVPPVVAPFLLRSEDGGERWSEVAVPEASGKVFFLVGVAAGDPQVVFARLDGAQSDTLLVSRDGGDHFTTAFTVEDDLGAFAALADERTVIAGTRFAGVRVSADNGATWPDAPAPPRMACVGQRGDGSLLACGANFDPDHFALATSTDGVAWTKLFRFEELRGVLACPAGSPARLECDPIFPALRATFQPATIDAGVADAGGGVDAAGTDVPPSGCGCGVGMALVFLWPRRRR